LAFSEKIKVNKGEKKDSYCFGITGAEDLFLLVVV
jgi:hypothetical protein